jgi:hypothetical protein
MYKQWMKKITYIGKLECNISIYKYSYYIQDGYTLFIVNRRKNKQQGGERTK